MLMRITKINNLALLILAITVFSCAWLLMRQAAQADTADKCILISTFKSDVTPPMGHFFDSGPLKVIEHPLLAKGIVLDDSGRRYVLCAVDWCVMRNSTHDAFREKLAASVKTDVSNVAVQCVHLHTAPLHDISGEKQLAKLEKAPKYIDLMSFDDITNRLVAAAKESLNHMQKVDSIGMGQAEVKRVASSRRIMENGKLYGRMSSTQDAKLKALPEGFIDPMLKTITLAQGDRPLVRLHYYATHPQSFYGDGRASWDVPGIARERLEQEEGVLQIYFTGCAGDVAMGKYNDGTPRARAKLADRLYQGMASSIASTKFTPISPLCWRTTEVLFKPRKEGRYDPVKNQDVMTDANAKDASRIEAASQLSCTHRLEKPIELCSMQIGDVYIVNLPGEPMVAFQKYAQASRPNSFVAVAGYGQCATGYICTETAFQEGGYEPSASAVQPSCENDLKKAIRNLMGVE